MTIQFESYVTKQLTETQKEVLSSLEDKYSNFVDWVHMVKASQKPSPETWLTELGYDLVKKSEPAPGGTLFQRRYNKIVNDTEMKMATKMDTILDLHFTERFNGKRSLPKVADMMAVLRKETREDTQKLIQHIVMNERRYIDPISACGQIAKNFERIIHLAAKEKLGVMLKTFDRRSYVSDLFTDKSEGVKNATAVLSKYMNDLFLEEYLELMRDQLDERMVKRIFLKSDLDTFELVAYRYLMDGDVQTRIKWLQKHFDNCAKNSISAIEAGVTMTDWRAMREAPKTNVDAEDVVYEELGKPSSNDS